MSKCHYCAAEAVVHLRVERIADHSSWGIYGCRKHADRVFGRLMSAADDAIPDPSGVSTRTGGSVNDDLHERPRYLREVITSEFYRGLRNGLLIGFAVGFAMAWVFGRVLEAP